MDFGKQEEVKFFYAPARNLRVGDVRLVTMRGQGAVKAILTTDWRFHIEQGFSAHVNRVLRVCFEFGAAKIGKLLLPPDGLSYLDCPGYGTYLPRGSGNDIEWQAL